MLNPGDRFGDYTVARLLGKGGMGSVFLLETAEGARVAAKILDPETAGDQIRMLRESATESPASPLASVRWSAKDHQGRASCPQVPTVVVRNVSAWNVLDMVCSSVNWCFETKGDVVENVTKMQTCVREVLEADAAFKAGIALTRLESEIARFVRLKTSPTAKCKLAAWEEQAAVLDVAVGKRLLFEWLRNKVEDGQANERLKKMAAAAAKDLESQDKRLQQLKKQAGIEF